jgi:hypothetical protein
MIFYVIIRQQNPTPVKVDRMTLSSIYTRLIRGAGSNARFLH